MKHPFIPDLYLDSVFGIDAALLRKNQTRAVMLDIDNTLVTYGMAEPTEEIIRWIRGLREEGIFVAIASNNHKERVDRFNEKLGVLTVCESKKPSRRAARTVAAAFGVSPREIAVIGDQIFTDVWCARRTGCFAILVRPLPYPENLFFRCKRLLEKPFLRAYRRREKQKKGDDRA